MSKIILESKGKEEYWSEEYECPYCKCIGMITLGDYCYFCGKKLNNVEFKDDED